MTFQNPDPVGVFRAAEHVPAIVEQCLALHSMGMTTAMGHCLLKETTRLKTA
ncbi:MAG TPA: hypothetical protein VF501_07775 [Thiobacillus sp.]